MKKTADCRPKTVSQMCTAYMEYADIYYRKTDRDGQRVPTKEIYNMRNAKDVLCQFCGRMSVKEPTADHLIQIQTALIEKGLCTTTINRMIQRIRRIFRWAAKPPRRWVPVTVMGEFDLVDSLVPGRTAARVSDGVKPVDWLDVKAVIDSAPQYLATMIALHWHTGARPCEIVEMRRSEVTCEGRVWLYIPVAHKTAHWGIVRRIAIGPKGVAVLRRWLNTIPQDQEKVFPIRTTNGYYQAVQRIIRGNGLKKWSINQIRHSFATRIRAQGGLDAAQLALGHTNARMTEVYAEPSPKALALAIARVG